MNKPIIEVRNLSKKYKIGERQRYLSLRDSVSNLFSSKNTEGPPFWALDDVSFDVQAGESIGIIGRNGAGKSTLLKILSRITPPTKGSVILRGRMASLLEVGTGFHSELTGRENVFMNGSILGLKKREIEAKFDEIVDFSGVEQFIDTPLKHYSSGMQLRLAFAVAAHLEPEILVIDEVLAVGDSIFQQKCIEKMMQLSQTENRTILFVSHNLFAVKQLCNKAILLENGRIVKSGETTMVTEFYGQNHVSNYRIVNLRKIQRTAFAQEVIFDRIEFKKSTYNFGENILFDLTILKKNVTDVLNDIEISVTIFNDDYQFMMHLSNVFINKTISFPINKDKIVYVFNVNSSGLCSGNYRMSLFLSSDGIVQDKLTHIVQFSIEEGNPYNYKNSSKIRGMIIPEFDIDTVI
jgi:lipopolysaccharide transport system ATP-binding protein